MSNITVSVIIPFYNQTDWLIEAVDSVFAQTFADFEVIVINDGSTEDISAFLDKYKHRIIYKWKENGGPASARNLGIELAKGKYIAFLDSDDIWYKNKLELQVRLMDKTGAFWSHTNYAQFHENNPDQVINYDLSYYSGNIFPQSLVSTHIATPCVMINGEYLRNRKDLRFDERMRFGQDYYLWLLLSVEKSLILTPEVLCKVRLRRSNAARRARAHIQVRTQIWCHLKDSPSRIFYKAKSYIFIRSIYKICKVEHIILLWLEERVRLNTRLVEFFARILFVFPYLSFKIMYKLFKNKRIKSTL